MYERFRKLIDEKGISHYRVSKDTGVPQSSLSDWKRGKSVPKVDKMKKIAEYLDVSYRYLTGESNEKKPLVNNDEELTEYLEELKTRPEMRMLFKLSSKATKEDVERTVKIIEALREKGE